MARLVQCVDCFSIAEQDSHGRCVVCGSEAITSKIFVARQKGSSAVSNIVAGGTLPA